MREKAIVEILLVRSVEESLPNFFSPETLLKATTEAGSIENKQEWLRKRAMYLFTQIPHGWKEITSITQPRAKLLIALTIIAFLIGLSSNFLGPSDHFHIIYNPIVILSVWNILIFFFFIFSMIRKLKTP
ncbi:MAG: hypothetical protein OEZ31_06855 [Nitrospirota bacterium]|nr:hypothetical protein [Nitrospirota bacterium]